MKPEMRLLGLRGIISLSKVEYSGTISIMMNMRPVNKYNCKMKKTCVVPPAKANPGRKMIPRKLNESMYDVHAILTHSGGARGDLRPISQCKRIIRPASILLSTTASHVG